MIHTSLNPTATQRSRPRDRATVGGTSRSRRPCARTRVPPRRGWKANAPAQPNTPRRCRAAASTRVLVLVLAPPPGNGMQLAQAGTAVTAFFRPPIFIQNRSRAVRVREVTSPVRGVPWSGLRAPQTATLSLVPARRPRPARPRATVLAGYKSCRGWRCKAIGRSS